MIWVIKIGGSLQNADSLPGFLANLVEHAAGRAVIVPGGGDFADQVRTQQSAMNFDDTTAHHKALRAMEQFGTMLMSYAPDLQPARTLNEITWLCARKKIPVWFPYAMVADNPSIPACWDVTSDTLALWLAEQMQCRHLFMLKATFPATENYSARYLAQHGFLDRAFVAMARKTAVISWWLHYQQATDFFHMLDTRDHPATIMNEIATFR